jgi:hypothetical protein
VAKKVDPAVAKAAKQKKLAIVGGVLLLGLLAFQVPRTMKMLHGQGTVTTSASTAPASTTPGSTPLAPPALDGGSAAPSGTSGTSAATSADGVSDPSTPLPPSSGQLMSFSQFRSKDPFRQQVQDCVSGESCATGASPAGGADTSAGTPSGGSAVPAKPAAPAAGAAATKPTTATISVNGKVERASLKGTFPAKAPVFVLVALTAKEAMIGIAGGSLDSGADAIGLKIGKTIKLQNTADGSTYVLTLISVS